jgi:hypothetical protein|tara:strand:+ start:2134 stop:2250 length:117 start_codon:yes stop_codon:yes gene_type:complete
MGTLGGIFDFSAMGGLMKSMGSSAKQFGSLFNPNSWTK